MWKKLLELKTQRATGRAELLFWPGQKRAGAATGPEGEGPMGAPQHTRRKGICVEKVAGT